MSSAGSRTPDSPSTAWAPRQGGADRRVRPERLPRYAQLGVRAGWRRENSFLSQRGTGVFCYGFYPHDPYPGYPATGKRPEGKGERYRATVVGPGVLPDVTWEGAAPIAYDGQSTDSWSRPSAPCTAPTPAASLSETARRPRSPRIDEGEPPAPPRVGVVSCRVSRSGLDRCPLRCSRRGPCLRDHLCPEGSGASSSALRREERGRPRSSSSTSLVSAPASLFSLAAMYWCARMM